MNLFTIMMTGLAVVLFLVGPVLFRLFRGSRRLQGGLEGFVIVGTTGLIFFHLLPAAVGWLGGWAVGFLLLGLVVPRLVQRSASLSEASTHRAVVLVVGGGIWVHAGLDAMVLADGLSDGQAVAWSMLLHQLPEGALLFWLMRRHWGGRAALGSVLGALMCLLAGVGLVALGGWDVGGRGEGLVWPALETLIGGALLYVVMREVQARGALHRGGELLGGAVGAGMVAATSYLGDGHLPSGHLAAYFGRFFELLATTAPALLLGYVLAGLVVAFLPRGSLRWLEGGGRTSQAMRGMMFGLPLPICSCGVVPLYQSLIRRGVPVPAALAFLVATPELGIDAILISFPLLGMELTLIRLVGAALVALAVGVLVGSWMQGRGEKGGEGGGDEELMASRPVGGRARMAMAADFGLNRVVDETAPWILAGLLIAAAISPDVLGGGMAALPFGMDVVLFAVVGIPLYVCASGSTPLAAAFILAGVSPGAAVAFLLAGPATNVTTFGVIADMHGRRSAVMFGVVMIASAVAAGLLVNGLFPEGFQLLASVGSHGEEVGWGSRLAVTLVGLLFVRSLLKSGLRAYLGTVFSMGAGHSHGGDEDCSGGGCCASSGHQEHGSHAHQGACGPEERDCHGEQGGKA